IKQLKAQYQAAWAAGKIDQRTFEMERGAIPIDLAEEGGLSIIRVGSDDVGALNFTPADMQRYEEEQEAEAEPEAA
ncbi:MAG: hypothetical protein AAFU70_03935, partial [Planctomycetota bacterium]